MLLATVQQQTNTAVVARPGFPLGDHQAESLVGPRDDSPLRGPVLLLVRVLVTEGHVLVESSLADCLGPAAMMRGR